MSMYKPWLLECDTIEDVPLPYENEWSCLSGKHNSLTKSWQFTMAKRLGYLEIKNRFHLTYGTHLISVSTW